MEDEELTAMLLKLQEQFARLFTTAVKRQAEDTLKNIQVVVDKSKINNVMPFKTVTNVSFGIFQDLGTGNRSGNPKKNEMYKEAEKSKASRIAPPNARKFSRGNTGGVRASFYQSIPLNLFTRYQQAKTKLLEKYSQDLTTQSFNV
jgi:hypothetical protein